MPTNIKYEQWIKCNIDINKVEGQCLIGKTFLNFFILYPNYDKHFFFLHNISKEKKQSNG
jgi:hypothetical protein